MIYGLFTLYYLTEFRTHIRKTPFIILLLAFVFLGLSVLSDLIKISGVNPYLFEDGFKMIGIISWLVYHFKVSKLEIEKLMQKQQLIFFQRGMDSKETSKLKKVVGGVNSN